MSIGRWLPGSWRKRSRANRVRRASSPWIPSTTSTVSLKFKFLDEFLMKFLSTVNSPQFEAGVRTLAEKLSVPHHPDHLQVLAAVSRVIKDNLNKESLKQPILEGKPFPIFDGQGMNQTDADVEQAARILRLLQIQSVREMQTVINETIVETQSLTSDAPRTDTRLGQVGR